MKHKEKLNLFFLYSISVFFNYAFRIRSLVSLMDLLILQGDIFLIKTFVLLVMESYKELSDSSNDFYEMENKVRAVILKTPSKEQEIINKIRSNN